jgi:FtsZ-binding cell division protein ZapB
MNLVRESNAHLRRENEELTSRLSTLDKQLKQLKDAAAPFEEEARTVKADKEALEAANVQLLTDAHYWRDRCVPCVAEHILSHPLLSS